MARPVIAMSFVTSTSVNRIALEILIDVLSFWKMCGVLSEIL